MKEQALFVSLKSKNYFICLQMFNMDVLKLFSLKTQCCGFIAKNAEKYYLQKLKNLPLCLQVEIAWHANINNLDLMETIVPNDEIDYDSIWRRHYEMVISPYESYMFPLERFYYRTKYFDILFNTCYLYKFNITVKIDIKKLQETKTNNDIYDQIISDFHQDSVILSIFEISAFLIKIFNIKFGNLKFDEQVGNEIWKKNWFNHVETIRIDGHDWERIKENNLEKLLNEVKKSIKRIKYDSISNESNQKLTVLNKMNEAFIIIIGNGEVEELNFTLHRCFGITKIHTIIKEYKESLKGLKHIRFYDSEKFNPTLSSDYNIIGYIMNEIPNSLIGFGLAFTEFPPPIEYSMCQDLENSLVSFLKRSKLEELKIEFYKLKHGENTIFRILDDENIQLEFLQLKFIESEDYFEPFDFKNTFNHLKILDWNMESASIKGNKAQILYSVIKNSPSLLVLIVSCSVYCSFAHPNNELDYLKISLYDLFKNAANIKYIELVFLIFNEGSEEAYEYSQLVHLETLIITYCLGLFENEQNIEILKQIIENSKNLKEIAISDESITNEIFAKLIGFLKEVVVKRINENMLEFKRMRICSSKIKINFIDEKTENNLKIIRSVCICEISAFKSGNRFFFF